MSLTTLLGPILMEVPGLAGCVPGHQMRHAAGAHASSSVSSLSISQKKCRKLKSPAQTNDLLHLRNGRE